MALPNLPRLTGTTTWTGTLPCTWTESVRRVGGGELAANGTPSNYVVRTHPLLRVTIRCYESEWNALLTFLLTEDAAGNSFTFHPDTNVGGTSYTVYLDSPSLMGGEEIGYVRDETDPSVLLVSIVLRRSTETAFNLPLYP